VHLAAQIGLLVAHLGFHAFRVLQEVFEDLRMRTGLESVDRRVSSDAPRTRPVVDDQELSRLRKEVVERANDHDVEVEKERRPAKIEERFRKRGELAPSAFLARRKIHFG
jgi:hypothetical protein